MTRWPRRLAVWLVHAYQLVFAPLMGGACRFEPSCSRYAITALERHGVLKGARLTVVRLAKCHPLGSHGVDPVPPSY